MANGKIRFGKQSGGELALVFPDGVDNTEVVFPESGVLATTTQVHAAITADVGVVNSALVKTALNATGSAPIYACRAWVNFNGTGTVAIRASGNVSSITDNGTGQYMVNFATAMPDANYSSNVSIGFTSINRADSVELQGSTVSSFQFRTFESGNTLSDVTYASVSIFR